MQLGNIYVCVVVYVCVGVCVCVCSDPPSVFSCNPEQSFHFPVITCIDFPQPCSDTHSHTHTHTHTHRYPMILKVMHTGVHACTHSYALVHTHFAYTHTRSLSLSDKEHCVQKQPCWSEISSHVWSLLLQSHTRRYAHTHRHILFLT